MSIAKKLNPFRGLASKEKVKYESHPYLGYRIQRNQRTTTIKINSLGLRGGEIDASRELVICIGNSTLFGSGLRDDETITHILNAKYQKYYFLNAGMSGYLINQEINLLMMLLRELSPKYVLLIDGFSECFFAYYNKDLNKPPYYYDIEFSNRRAKSIWSRVKYACGLLKKKNHGYPAPPPTELVDNYVYHFSLIRALALGRGFGAISFIQPTSYYSLRQNGKHNHPWKKVGKIEKQFPGFTEYVYDTYAEFRNASSRVEDLVFLGDLFGADIEDKYLDGTHYTYRGAVEIAAAIENELERRESAPVASPMMGNAC